MISIAIQILWVLIGIIILAGIIYLAIWIIEQFVYPIPERIKQAIWVVFLLLCLIALLTLLAGGGAGFFHHAGIPGASPAAISVPAGRYLQGVLT